MGREGSCLQASKVYIFQSERDTALNEARAGIFFHSTLLGNTQATNSDWQLVHSIQRNWALQKSLLGLLGMSWATPKTSLFHPVSKQGSAIQSHKSSCKFRVCPVPDPRGLLGKSGPRASGTQLHLLFLCKLLNSYCSSEGSPRSVINYYVVAKIHRPAENTEC